MLFNQARVNQVLLPYKEFCRVKILFLMIECNQVLNTIATVQGV